MARRAWPTLALGVLAFCTGVVVALMALLLGFTFEASSSDVANSAKGHQIAVPAVVAIVTGVVAIAGWRRRWGFVVACVAAAAAVVAVLLTMLLPGGDM